jgi:hypothetical protein
VEWVSLIVAIGALGVAVRSVFYARSADKRAAAAEKRAERAEERAELRQPLPDTGLTLMVEWKDAEGTHGPESTGLHPQRSA